MLTPLSTDDAHLARLNAPTGNQAEKAGEKAAYETRLNVDQAVRFKPLPSLPSLFPSDLNLLIYFKEKLCNSR